MKQPIKMTPGDELHLTALMAPFSLNLVTGQDRQHLLGYGRAAFEAGKAGQCLHQIQEPAAAEQAAWHAGLDGGRAQAADQELKAQHSTACLYGYALARLGLTDTPQMRVLFWDAHEALQWDEKTDQYIVPSAEGDCSQCGHVQEPSSNKAAPAAVAVPDAVTDEMVHAALRVQHPNMYREYLRHPANGPAIEAKTEKEIDTARKMIAAALAATPAAAPVVLPEPVGWRHSRTLTLHETEQEVQLADGDSHAQPLFTEQQLRALLAAGEEAQAAPAFYAALGSNGCALPQYSASTEEGVIFNVLSVARNEGYKGSGLDRLIELGWVVRPVYTRPAPATADSLATATGLPAQAVLDYPWRDRLLDGRELVRDQQGFAEHPELPLLDEGMKPRAFFAALGVEMKHTMADDDLSMDEYDAMSDAENWSAWMPRPPIGDAWNLVAIFDTEDGPAAWWMRELRASQEGVAT